MAGGPELRCQSRSVGPMDNNAYLLSCDNGHHVLVDAAAEPEVLLEWIGDRRVDAVITTHSHPDHIGALAAVVEATGASAWCGTPDLASIVDQTGVHQHGVWSGDHIAVGDEQLEVIGLVGHTPGSIALVVTGDPAILLTGDSLFPGGLGKTRTPDDFNSLFADVSSKIFDRFGDDTQILPGHGAATTLGAERPQLGAWRARGW